MSKPTPTNLPASLRAALAQVRAGVSFADAAESCNVEVDDLIVVWNEQHPDRPFAAAKTARPDAAQNTTLSEHEEIARIINTHVGPRMVQAALPNGQLVGRPTLGLGLTGVHKAVDAILARRAPVAPAEPVAWQPIETAPKDGTQFVSQDRVNYGDREFQGTHWYTHPSTTGWNTDDLDCGDYEWEPTHWRPNPATPAQPSTVSAEGLREEARSILNSELGDVTDAFDRLGDEDQEDVVVRLAVALGRLSSRGI